MFYHYAILFAVAVLVVRHIRSASASTRSKRIVGGLAAFSLLAPYLWPSFLPLAGQVGPATMWLPVALGVYVVFHEKIHDEAPRNSVEPRSAFRYYDPQLRGPSQLEERLDVSECSDHPAR
jgi:hypothetical protein